MTYHKVYNFWFQDLEPSDWWKKSDALDLEIKNRFLDLHHKASIGELFSWRKDAKGRLCEILVLDQFSRHIFRDHAKSFYYDSMALALAQEAVSNHADKDLNAKEKAFLYMPYMHSESLIIHQEAAKLFSQEGLEKELDFEYQHKRIIERFGRYPHRNKILNRPSSKEEIEFLKEENSSF